MILEGPNYVYSKIISKIAFYTKSAYAKPTRVIVLFTNRCNSQCLHCHSWKQNPRNKELGTGEWEWVFKELRNWLGPVFLSITGGETLLRADSIHLTKYAASLGFWVEFLTNGYMMKPQLASQLVGSGVKRIKISLDGSSQEVHDKIRGRSGFFLKATEALRALTDEKHRQCKEVKIWAKTTIMSLNVEDLPNILKLAKQTGIDGVEFQALEPVYYSDQLKDLKWFENNPLWVTDIKKLTEAIQKLRELKNQGYPIVNTIENLNMIESYFNDPQKLAFRVHSHEYKKKDQRCISWIGGLQIMPDGGMKMCHWMDPFAYTREGNIKLAWKNRDRCWKKPCPYILHNS